MRVHTARGWVVLASDASHFYENMEAQRPFPSVFHVGEMMAGYDILRRLADTPEHIVPGHDPQVMALYPPASDAFAGAIARLDLAPRTRAAGAGGTGH